MDEAQFIKKLEKEITFIKEECRARGKGIRAFRDKSVRRLESAASDLEYINPDHPDVKLMDELILSLEGEKAYDPTLFQEMKTAQSEDVKMVKHLKKLMTDFQRADSARQKAIKRIVDLMREYQLRLS